MPFTPRPGQDTVTAFRAGWMGVSAVPGSGKTYTLSNLAARLIRANVLAADQEVLIVTLVNAAVDNFRTRIKTFIEEYGLFRGLQYRVRTLHGLAHDIVRERPALAGLGDRFDILDERESGLLLAQVVNARAPEIAALWPDYANPTLTDHQYQRAQRDDFPSLINDLANAFIRTAKDRRLSASALLERLAGRERDLPLAFLCAQIYADYQQGLAYRGAVDFSDLIQLALHTLDQDAQYRARLQRRWPYILEDEAQDSSELQEVMLRTLAGDSGHWVRVGDPNQAIYETFTTADPKYLRDFLANPRVQPVDLPASGRCQPAIIALANRLIAWTQHEHPVIDLRDALKPPYIQPVGPDDPQPNPPDNPTAIHIFDRDFTPEDEVDAIVRSLIRWLPENPDKTVAILTPTNSRGTRFTEVLTRAGLPYTELLQSTLETRQTAEVLRAILAHLADPKALRPLTDVYKIWAKRRSERAALAADPAEDSPDADAAPPAAPDDTPRRVLRLLNACPQIESYLWPHPAADWLATLDLTADDPTRRDLGDFRTAIQRWQTAALLPIDQLLLTLGQDLFTEAAELALTHKLATLLRRSAQSHPDWRLPHFARELADIAHNERKFLGFTEDIAFNPDDHKGIVTVTTMHKAKGLEWDRVYLTSLNSYDFPAAQQADSYFSEKWFIRDGLNLEAETLAQLDAARLNHPYTERDATLAARVKVASERLRLLYVGITRARRDLILTWNTGRRGDQQPALAFRALHAHWNSR